jgi:hypothetical protein
MGDLSKDFLPTAIAWKHQFFFLLTAFLKAHRNTL